MEILVQRAQFIDFEGISRVMAYPPFLFVDLLGNKIENSAEYFVAKVKGEIVGFAQLTHIMHKECELVRLYVVPNYQRKGIGSLLLKKCCSMLKKQTRLVVKVEKRNLKAINFYERFGFQQIREIYGVGGNLLLEYWRYI